MKRRQFITLLGGGGGVAVNSARAAGEDATGRGVHASLGERPDDEGLSRRPRAGACAARMEPKPQSATRIAHLRWRRHRCQCRIGGLGETESEVILSHGTETSRIMQQHTRTIPIVFTTVTDPVGSGLVESLARPGGNTTGFTNFEFSMAGKWLELIKEVGVKNIAVIFNPENAAMPGQLRAIALAAPALGLQVTEAKVSDRGGIERAINALAQTPNAGFIVLPENLV